MALEASAIVAFTAIVERVIESTSLAIKPGTLKIWQWRDRTKGLKLLKALPRGLEALVCGEDVTPEILAALSLGGRPGHELSTFALLTTTDLGIVDSDDDYLYTLHHDEATPPRDCPTQAPTLMDGGSHKIYLLDGQAGKEIRVNRRMLLAKCSSETGRALNENEDVVVVGYAIRPYGVVVYGSQDKCFYYCEYRSGQLECSSVDMPPEDKPKVDVTSTNKHSKVFTVTPKTLTPYSDFFRMCRLLVTHNEGVVELLGLVKAAQSLGIGFADTMRVAAGSSEGLLSLQHLQNVHNRVGSGHGPLKMPKDIKTLVSETAEALPLHDRKYERTRFGSTQESTAAYVEAVRSLAGATGNVGVRATESEQSCLIKSCVVGSLRMEPSFAIFDGFRRSKVNIAVSPGCTAIYFPGLNMTVAFPDGSVTGAAVREFRPACPFTSDLSETFRILMDLAPTIGKGRLRKVACALSEELAADPALVLDPVTENVVRSFYSDVDEAPAQHSLAKLLTSSSLGEGRLHREAALAGVLCQLGLGFSKPDDGDDMRCFFDRCREAGWGRARGIVGDVRVDCPVNVHGCYVYTVRTGQFLGSGTSEGVGYYAKLTGPHREQGGNYHLENTDESEVFRGNTPRTRAGKCYVGSSGTTVLYIDDGLTCRQPR